MTGPNAPIIEMTNISKSYAHIRALEGVSVAVRAGEVTCVLGDNGAGKSTLIKIMGGLHHYDAGAMKVNGTEVRFNSPRDALNAGIATVYQDLAVVDLMETWRNFFLGSEVRKRVPVLKPMDIAGMRETTSEELAKLGIHLDDVNQPLGTLSGGQRQCVAIARAVYFGAKVLILDEPTASLGVNQSGVVLKYVAKARESGIGVVFITHNPHHAYLIGDHFAVLKLGRMSLDAKRSEITVDQLVREMAGGDELAALAHELDRSGAAEPGAVEAIDEIQAR
jgi:simple sugar transport system ATP-binding protein